MVNEIRQLGREAECFPGNVLDEKFPQRLVDDVLKKWGRINGLINNAGMDYCLYLSGPPPTRARILTDGFRILLRQCHSQNARREIRHHHENAQLHSVSHDPGPIFALDGPSAQWNAQDRHQRRFNVWSAWIHGPDQLCHSKGRYHRTHQNRCLGMEPVGPVASPVHNYIVVSRVHVLTCLVCLRYNVRANAVAYGWIDTRITRPPTEAEVLELDGQAIQPGIPLKAKKWRDVSDIPLARPGTAHEAAKVMLFLASPLSSYVTGTCIECTGGRFM